MKPFVVHVKSGCGTWGVEGTSEGVSRILLPNQKVPASKGDAPKEVAECARQLDEYLQGTREKFKVKLAPVTATAFQRDVWDALCDIPYGHVATYADVAEDIVRPLAMRAVGNANHNNPWPLLVPCHRVVAKGGIGGYGGGEEVKRFLLELEGIDQY